MTTQGNSFYHPTAPPGLDIYKGLNKTRRKPPPGAPQEYTDVDGTTLAVSANGDGTVLIEMGNDTTHQHLAMTLQPVDLIGVWRAMVDATGLHPTELRKALQRNHIASTPAPATLTRQQRRANERKKNK